MSLQKTRICMHFVRLKRNIIKQTTYFFLLLFHSTLFIRSVTNSLVSPLLKSISPDPSAQTLVDSSFTNLSATLTSFDFYVLSGFWNRPGFPIFYSTHFIVTVPLFFVLNILSDFHLIIYC